MYLKIIFLAILCSCVASAQTIVVNEFMADNHNTVVDQNGEYDDWIELYNCTDQTISLNGWHLSDSHNDLFKWSFPDTSLAAHEFLAVWADEDLDQSGLHADFKLSASGEAIYLLDSIGNLVDQIVFGPQKNDISFGRYPDGTGLFAEMTPSFAVQNFEPIDPDTDTSGIFGDTLIHTINLEFYVTDWADSLKYNFEVLDEQYMPARLTFDGVTIMDSIGVRYKGNSSYVISSNTAKKPFEFKFDKYREEQTLKGLKKLNVQNGVCDPSFMRETISYKIARDYMPAPRTAYADLSVGGQLLGFYILVEQVDKIFLARYFADNGGNLFKASDNGGTLEYRGTEPSAYESEYELKTNEDENDWSRFIEMITRLNASSDGALIDTMRQCLDLDLCLRLLAFNMVLSNYDSYTGSGRNFYMYDDPVSEVFKIIPWDLNESFGVYTNNWNVITQDAVDISNLARRPLNRRILANDSLRGAYLNYISDMMSGPARTDSVAIMAERLKTVIADHVMADTNKLYSDQDFINNIENDVYIGLGQIAPGIKSFSRERNANLAAWLDRRLVYPGDADNNGIVNEMDILPIALYFGTSGTVRDSMTFVWEAYESLPWTIPAATYADANGDGKVDEKDIIGIGVNWHNTHVVEGTSYEIDPQSLPLSDQVRDNLKILSLNLVGSTESTREIKALLDAILGRINDSRLPGNFSLEQNYPNPFNPKTVVSFTLTDRQAVTLTVYDILGRPIIHLLENKLLEAGRHSYNLDFSTYASGTYFCRLQNSSGSLVRKMTLIK